MKALSEAERNEIRSEAKQGNIRRYIYNKKALEVLHRTQTKRKIPKQLIEASRKKEEFTELEHYKVLYQNALKRIDELKTELSDLKQEKREEVKEYKEDAKEQTKRFNEAIRYFEDLVKDTQNLMSQQQKLHYKELDKKNIEAPKKSILNVFRR